MRKSTKCKRLHLLKVNFVKSQYFSGTLAYGITANANSSPVVEKKNHATSRDFPENAQT